MANVMVEVRKLLHQRHQSTHFVATVTDTSGSTIQVQRDGQTVPDGSFYAATDGLAAAVVAGDRVFVVDVSGDGGYLVLAKLA